MLTVSEVWLRGFCTWACRGPGLRGSGFTHRPLSSSFLGLPCRILNINHKKKLLRGLLVGFRV